MLGAYEDSEEEDSSEASSSAAKAKLNRSADIDSTLASFMAVSNLLFIWLIWWSLDVFLSYLF